MSFFTELVSCNSFDPCVCSDLQVICFTSIILSLFGFISAVAAIFTFFRGRAGVCGCWHYNTPALHLQSLLCSALNPGSYSHSLPQYSTSHTGSAANLLRMKTCEPLLLFIPEILILLSCVHSSLPARPALF